LAVGLLALAACGGTAVATTSSTGHRHHRTLIGSVWNGGYGFVLVGPNRHALYMFFANKAAHRRGHHERGFLPLIAHGRLVASRGSRESDSSQINPVSRPRQSKLGTVRLTSDRRQVTYFGQRLYVYRGDHRSAKTAIHGESKDQDQWKLIDPQSGHPALPAAY
jgi:hypothetical protein